MFGFMKKAGFASGLTKLRSLFSIVPEKKPALAHAATHKAVMHNSLHIGLEGPKGPGSL